MGSFLQTRSCTKRRKAMGWPCVDKVNFALLTCHYVTPPHWANMGTNEQDKWETIIKARVGYFFQNESHPEYKEANYKKRISSDDLTEMKKCCSSACTGEADDKVYGGDRTGSNHPNNMDDYCAA